MIKSFKKVLEAGCSPDVFASLTLPQTFLLHDEKRSDDGYTNYAAALKKRNEWIAEQQQKAQAHER